jgi:putative ABC transport system permease protein
LTIPRARDGRRVPVPESGLLMSRHLAEALDVGRGDTVTVVPIRGKRDPRRVTVERIVDGYLGMVTYADYDWLNRLVDEAGAISAVQMEARSDLESRLRLYRALKELPAVQAVTDNEQAKEKLVTILLDLLRYSIAVLVAMAAVIFFGSILTTSLISISQRQREIATFAVIGYDLRQIGGIFLRESLIVNVLGAAAGLPAGLWLSIWVIEANSRDAYRLPFVASPSSYLITIVLAVAFTVLAHLLVQRAINRLDWLEALNAKE